MMEPVTPPPLADAIRQRDHAEFCALAGQAVQGRPTEALLHELAGYLQLSSLELRRTADAPPDIARAVVVPLVFGVRYLGDLYAAVPPAVDTVPVAQRLALFAQLFALLLAGESNACCSDASDAPAWISDIQQERERLEAVLESTNEALLLLDTDARVVMVTRAFETFTGLPRYDLMGQPVQVLAGQIEAAPGLPQRMANMLRALAGNQTDSLGGEFEVSAPQRRMLVWYSVPVYVQSGVLLGRVFAFRDATRERELDRMKTDFVALVSHELRTPLTSVKGFSDLILEDETAQLDDEQREYLRIIALNADRLIDLLNDILDVTRIDSDRVEMKPSACAIDDVIHEVALTLNPAITARQHHLALAIEPNLPAVWADHDRMVQILTNLLSNAVKYTLDPGEIGIAARYIRQPDDLPASASGTPILPCVLVSVTDTGLGISDLDQQHLFERFYRVDIQANRRISGTGLGLTIARAFVEMHGGKIWLDSTPNEGSTFYFTIPTTETNTLENF